MAQTTDNREKINALLSALGIDTSTCVKCVLTFELDGMVTAEVTRHVTPLQLDEAGQAVKTELANFILVEDSVIDVTTKDN